MCYTLFGEEYTAPDYVASEIIIFPYMYGSVPIINGSLVSRLVVITFSGNNSRGANYESELAGTIRVWFMFCVGIARFCVNVLSGIELYDICKDTANQIVRFTWLFWQLLTRISFMGCLINFELVLIGQRPQDLSFDKLA